MPTACASSCTTETWFPFSIAAPNSRSQIVLSKPAVRKITAENLPKPVGPYSPATGTKKLVFVSGQSGRDPATGKTAEGVEAQTEQTLKNVETILKAAGTDLQHVLRCGV